MMHIPASARAGSSSTGYSGSGGPGAGESSYSLPQLPILAGEGPTLIHAAVAHHPTPQAPPAGLEDVVAPIRDDLGNVRDWKLASDEAPRAKADFARWHDGFVTEAVIGDVATARSLMHWGRGRIDLSELGILQLPHARISARHARRLAWQLRAAAEECSTLHAFGLGIAASPQSGLARGFLCAEGPLMLLAEGGAWVAASAAGLVVHADEQDMTLLVHGWKVADGNVTAYTDEGEVDLWTSRAGMLLVRVAPGLREAVVQQVPLTKVFAGFFVTLADMALLAALGNTHLLVDRAGPRAA
jgi:hypothetical protein